MDKTGCAVVAAPLLPLRSLLSCSSHILRCVFVAVFDVRSVLSRLHGRHVVLARAVLCYAVSSIRGSVVGRGARRSGLVKIVNLPFGRRCCRSHYTVLLCRGGRLCSSCILLVLLNGRGGRSLHYCPRLLRGYHGPTAI